MFRKILISMTVMVMCTAQAFAAEYNAPMVDRAGVIQEVNIGDQEIIISGHRYSVSQTVNVTIAGSYGAFTLLQEGMRVRYTYHRFDDGTRRIIQIDELSDQEVLEDA